MSTHEESQDVHSNVVIEHLGNCQECWKTVEMMGSGTQFALLFSQVCEFEIFDLLRINEKEKNSWQLVLSYNTTGLRLEETASRRHETIYRTISSSLSLLFS